MNKTEIEASIREKYNDEYTVKMFTNFALEFQECFSDIMGTEELIERIKKNILGNIVIREEFENKNLDGRYARDGYIQLKKSVTENERYTKYLLFHEMLHAITSVRDENGNEVMMGFSYLENSYGMGLNEAMTEYLTQIRNEKFDSNSKDLISGYRTIVEQIRRLILIIGDKELKQAYFYNPNELKNILSKNNMNYDELELAYRKLSGKDYDINAMASGIKLENNENYTLHRFSEIIFSNYAKALGEVKSLDDLKRKYKTFQTYFDGKYDCISSMFLTYYQNVGKDIDMLLKQKVPFNDIKETLQGLNLNINNVAAWYNFSKCLIKDKNDSAVKLYEFYNKNPQAYFGIFAQSYGILYDHFSECDSNPGNDGLYNGYRYPMIGWFLKEHQEMDFSEVSFDIMEEKHSKKVMFIFSTADGKKHAYTTDGEKAKRILEEDGSESFEYTINDKCKGKLTYKKDGTLGYSFNSSSDFDLEEFMNHLDFKIQHTYSEKEDIEYWINQGGDKDGFYSKALDRINNRIETRREVDFFDV